MDLFNKAKEITMISLSILYNTNLVPLAICGLPLAIDPEQQRSSANEKLHKKDTSILIKKKKTKRKIVHGVIIKEVNMRASNDNLSILKSSQSCVIGKTKMINNEIPSSDISTQPNIFSGEPLQRATTSREDDVKDVNDDDIGTEMNREPPLEDLSSLKAKLNYN
jgi:hypothetical protein